MQLAYYMALASLKALKKLTRYGYCYNSEFVLFILFLVVFKIASTSNVSHGDYREYGPH